MRWKGMWCDENGGVLVVIGPGEKAVRDIHRGREGGRVPGNVGWGGREVAGLRHISIGSRIVQVRLPMGRLWLFETGFGRSSLVEPVTPSLGVKGRGPVGEVR